MKMKQLGGLAAALAIVALFVAIGTSQAGANPADDQRVADCGASTPGNKVLATFDLDRAKNFWRHFPAALGAPELQNDLPALVVVFKGDYTWFRTGEVFQHVVCVYQDGYPNIYPGVDLVGMKLQP